MSGFWKATAIVLGMSAAFVCCGEILTEVSRGGGTSVGGGVGVEQGEAIFFGKGKCYTCHAIGDRGSAVRCPNLGVAGERFKQAVGLRAEAVGQERGISAMEYLVESLYDPNAFVVAGYPKGLMPPVHRPPISLGQEDIASLILFLFAESDIELDQDQLEEMKALQQRYAAAGGGEDPVPPVSIPGGMAETGFEAYIVNGCWKCHTVKGITIKSEEKLPPGSVGPELTSIGAIQTREYLIESILDPNAVIVADPPGVVRGSTTSYVIETGMSRMPSYLAAMTIQDMLDIGEFLRRLKDEKSNAEQFEGTADVPALIQKAALNPAIPQAGAASDSDE